MVILDNIISDRGSKYAVSGGGCHSADDAKAFLKQLKRKKKFAKATHNTWAVICGDDEIKNDDARAVPDDHSANVGARGVAQSHYCGDTLVWRQAFGRRSLSPCKGCCADLSGRALGELAEEFGAVKHDFEFFHALTGFWPSAGLHVGNNGFHQQHHGH